VAPPSPAVAPAGTTTGPQVVMTPDPPPAMQAGVPFYPWMSRWMPYQQSRYKIVLTSSICNKNTESLASSAYLYQLRCLFLCHMVNTTLGKSYRPSSARAGH